MNNIFSDTEEDILSNEEILFDKNKIKSYLEETISKRLNSKDDKKHFIFEKIIYDFFEYLRIPLIKTKKTRDSGLDGIIKLKLDLLGEIDVGLQIKHKKIDSTDVDLFLSALKFAEIQLGTIFCKDSRKLQKYELNSKIKTILLSKGVELKENLIKDKIDINPVSILKVDDILEIVSSNIRDAAKSIYKR